MNLNVVDYIQLIINRSLHRFFIFFTVPTLSLSSEIYVALETDGSVKVCAVLNLPRAIPLNFIVTATDTGTATAGIVTSTVHT